MSQILSISGTITRETVVEQLERVNEMLSSSTRTVDLSGVTTVDSTALAFWVEVERRAVQLELSQLSWTGIPEQMISIAKLVGMDAMILR